jgi:hypothetical protein
MAEGTKDQGAKVTGGGGFKLSLSTDDGKLLMMEDVDVATGTKPCIRTTARIVRSVVGRTPPGARR